MSVEIFSRDFGSDSDEELFFAFMRIWDTRAFHQPHIEPSREINNMKTEKGKMARENTTRGTSTATSTTIRGS